MLEKSADFLSEANSKLEQSATDEEKEGIIKQFVEEFREREEIKNKSMKEFKKIAEELNNQYKKVWNINVLKEMDKLRGSNDIKFEDTESFNKAAKGGYKPWWLIYEEQKDKYDSNRVRELLDGYTELTAQEEDNKDYKNIVIQLEKLIQYQVNLEKKLEQIVFTRESAELPKDFKNKIIEDINHYESEIKEADKKIYFPVGISSELPKENEVNTKPIDSLAYMFWLQNQGRNSEIIVCDTLQESNYQSLYNLKKDEARQKALENGEKDKEWYGATIKAFNLNNINLENYQELEQYSETNNNLELIERIKKENPILAQAFSRVTQESVKEKAGEDVEALEKYGKTEIAFIMSKNGLKVGHEKEIRYDILARIIPVYEELKKHIKEIPELEKSENINQDLIDLSLYLSNFHNYPESYHRLANLYSERDNIESELKAAKKEKSQAKNRHDFDKVASSVNQLKIKESGIKKEVEKIKNEMKKFEMSKLIDYNIKSLGLTERPEEASAKWRDTGKKLTESEWFKKINLPEFHYPKNISSLSFEMDKGEKKEHIGFREPYSTYKGESKEEIPIEANQVIASTNPLAAAKLLVLSQEKQKEYTNKVLRPLLVNYYLATSENKEEAIKKYREDIKDVKTTSEIIHLIQEKIISPIEKEL